MRLEIVQFQTKPGRLTIGLQAVNVVNLPHKQAGLETRRRRGRPPHKQIASAWIRGGHLLLNEGQIAGDGGHVRRLVFQVQ